LYQNLTSIFKLETIFLSRNTKVALKVKGQGQNADNVSFCG